MTSHLSPALPMLAVPANPSAAAKSAYVTITGTVTQTGTEPSAYVIVDAGSKDVRVFTGLLGAARIGDVVTATGTINSLGSLQAVSASIVGASSTPPPAGGGFGASGAVGTIPQFQIFDYAMSAAQSTSAARAFSSVWGAGTGMAGATPQTWHNGNQRLIATQYFVQGTDHNAISGHDIAWWKANHPDWVVYDCDENNRPTRTVAYQPGLDQDVPLDISNPDVVAYQVRSAAEFGLARGVNAIGADQTLFFDYDGNQRHGWYGCGTYNRSGAFVHRWGTARGGFPNYDPKWNADVAAWVRTAHHLLTTDPALARHGIKFYVNHPAGSLADPNERTLLANVDGVLDETGFIGYGSYPRNPALFRTALEYMTFAQREGTHVFEVAKFSGGQSGDSKRGSLSAAQLSYAIASFLIGNEGRASLFITPGPYGMAYSYPQVAQVNATLGNACAAYTTLEGGRLYVRRFNRGLVVLNPGGFGTASMALNHVYRELTGNDVHGEISVGAAEAYVLFTREDGCR
ncbi:MAG: hypothetical protein NVSMB64_01710 [Candidatus Velthaea sp.]